MSGKLTFRRLLLPVVSAFLSVLAGHSEEATERPTTEEYRVRLALRDVVVARIERETGKRFDEYTDRDYAAFMRALDLGRDEDLWTWSHVTGIPVFALGRGVEFFRSDAHLLADEAAASVTSAEAFREIRSTYLTKKGKLRLEDADGRSLPLRELAETPVRRLDSTGQVLHNPGFAADVTRLDAIGPFLARFEDLPQRKELLDGIRSLPLSVVRMLRGKALYLSVKQGEGETALWGYVGSDRAPEYAGMQPGVFLERRAEGQNADAFVRAVGRIVRETVLESRYFGIYAYPYQFPELQKLNTERRRLFGRRRDRLPRTEHGYVSAAASTDATQNFVEHFHAYIRMKDRFRSHALAEQAAGHPELSSKLSFMERLVEQTPQTIERLSPVHLTRIDAAEQWRILEEYHDGASRKEQVVKRVQKDFGKTFSEFTGDDYRRFMDGLDLNRDDDLWTWSSVTDVPIVALNQRSNFFHMNAHLLEDSAAALRMSWSELTGIRNRYDRKSGQLRLTAGDGRPLRLRSLPDGLILSTEKTGSVLHNKDFVEDRIVYEALLPYLVRLGDLENRETFGEGLRLLPLSVVKALRGKALYPTDRSKTGWAITGRVGNEETPSYAGMQPGGLIEPRRDSAPPDRLVSRGLGSLAGSSADSLVHEVGHIIDQSVIGGTPDAAAFPYQFPEFQKLLDEKNRLFGAGSVRVPRNDHGYISDYAKENGQENFAEHFWAYIRDRNGFLLRALQENSAGHTELLDKFRFMEKLVAFTTPTGHRLSRVYLESLEQPYGPARAERQRGLLEQYLGRRASRDSVVASVHETLGKRFTDWTREDYDRFMTTLDLERDDDLWTWSHVTGITIVGVSQGSNFFYVNAHLLADVEAAMRMPAAEILRIGRDFDETHDRLRLLAPDGRELRVREIPAKTIRVSGQTGAFLHDGDYAESRTVFETLEPYLVALDEIPNRPALVAGLRSLPLSVIKTYRGKGIYLTTSVGRGYSVGMPVSTSAYTCFAGMQPGFFLGRMSPDSTTHNLVHEFGHVIDYTVIMGRYGNYLHHYQYPQFRKLEEEKNRVFGVGDQSVPQTSHGYVSDYAKTNAQESFAEHFAWYVLKKDEFRAQAERELLEGYEGLIEKYHFLETLFERTPATQVELSRNHIEELD